ECARLIANIDHLDVVVRARIGAGGTANAGAIIDDDSPAILFAMNGARGTTDQADRVGAMHTGIHDHGVFVSVTVARKARIVVVGGGAGPDAVIATDAAIQIDHHCVGTIDEAMIHDKVQHALPQLILSHLFRHYAASLQKSGRQSGQYVLDDQIGRDADD